MSYYWFNREKMLNDAKYKYHNKGDKEKATKYYTTNRDVIKKQPISIETCQKKEKIFCII